MVGIRAGVRGTLNNQSESRSTDCAAKKKENCLEQHLLTYILAGVQYRDYKPVL